MTEKTRAIKMRLQEYADMRREYEIQLERLDRLRASVDYKSPSFEQMPKGGGFKDKMVEHVARVEELEEAMGKDLKTMQDERKYLDGLIKKLPKADERAVIRMKYFDCIGWMDITSALFWESLITRPQQGLTYSALTSSTAPLLSPLQRYITVVIGSNR